MRMLNGLLMVGVFVGLVWGASAQPKPSELLLGDWKGYAGQCSPCLISITDIKEDGQLVLRFEMGADQIEAWGRVTRHGKRDGVDITTAGGHKIDLELSKSGKRLYGTFTLEAGHGTGVNISLDRVRPQK